MEPRYNEPLHNKVLRMTDDFLHPSMIADFYRFGVHYAKVTFCSKETIIPNPKSVYFVAFVVYQEIQESASYTNSFYSEPLLLNNLFSTMLMLSFLEVVIREVIKN